MTDVIKKGPIPNAVISSVNGISKPSVWILGDNIGAPGRVYPDSPDDASQLGCVKAGTNITISEDGTISATGALGTDWSNITNKPTVFPPTPATATTLGGVKAGANITISGDGIISSTVVDSIDWAQVTDKPVTFTPPVASAFVLGGIKVGSGLNISADGTLTIETVAPSWDVITNKPAVFPVAKATSTTLGGVIAGPGISVDGNGVISTTDVTTFVNQYTDANMDPTLAKNGSWTVPDNVSYFRVTLIGPGGKGGQSGGNAEKWAGGGGGGGGAMYQFLVNAYKFQERIFRYTLGASTGVYPTFTGTCNFFDGKGEQLCIVGGGQNGEDGDANNPASLGFSRGGRGGSVARLLPNNDDRFGPSYYASGGEGGFGLRIATTADVTKHKSLGGVGGMSGGGSGIDGLSNGTNGFGGGAPGGGDNYPYGISNAGFSYIRIEW